MNILCIALHRSLRVSYLLLLYTRVSDLFLRFRYCELRIQNIYKRISNRVRIPQLYSTLFSDSGVALVLSMVCSSLDIKQVYNCKANDVGPV